MQEGRGGGRGGFATARLGEAVWLEGWIIKANGWGWIRAVGCCLTTPPPPAQRARSEPQERDCGSVSIRGARVRLHVRRPCPGAAGSGPKP